MKDHEIFFFIVLPMGIAVMVWLIIIAISVKTDDGVDGPTVKDTFEEMNDND